MEADKADFEVATLRGRLKAEVIGLSLSAVFVILRSIAQFSGNLRSNWVPTVVAFACLLVHVMTMRWRNTFWVSVITMVLDCLMSATGHRMVQCAFWSWAYAPLHIGEIPDDDIVETDFYYFEYEGLLHDFLLFLWMSYFAEFVYLAKHVAAGIPAGLMCYFAMVCLARSVLAPNFDLVFSWAQGIFGMAFLGFGMMKVSIAKKISETHARETFELVSAQRKEVITERTLRYQAEFRIESLKGPLVGGRAAYQDSESSYLDHVCAEHAGREPPGAPPKAPASLVSQRSAPADMLPATLQSFLREAAVRQDTASLGNDCDGICDAMDCFPVDAVVWAEGHSTPIAVSEVVPNQRILCFDSLKGSVKYAAVSSVTIDSEAVEWAEVVLVDGTKLTMTSDHPVQPASAIGQTLSQRVVPASELSPMSDSIMVHKVVTVPITVASVSCHSAAESDMRDRVSLEVCQPGRHHVLVAAPGQNADVRSLAVASVSQGRRRASIKNGFIHVPSGEEVLRGPRRAESEPPPARSAAVDDEGGSVPASPRRTVSSGNISSPASLHSAESLSASSGPDLVVIPDTSPRGERDRSSAGARLSYMLDAKRAGLPSIGSDSHAAGACMPCQLAFRGACRSGIACHYCHGEHRMRRIKGKKILLSDRQQAHVAEAPIPGREHTSVARSSGDAHPP